MNLYTNIKKYNILAGVFSFSLLIFNFANAQQLETFINQALLNNPKVQIMELRYDMATEKINKINTLPNTDISAGYFISEPETRMGAQKIRLSVKQMFPWFGTITARENYARAMADTEYINIAIAKRKLTLSVSQSYYILYAIKEKQRVLDQNNKLLKTYEKLALTTVEVGKTSVVDVLQIQIRQNELKQRKSVLEYQFLEEQTRLNKLLNRDGNTQITITDKLQIPKEDIVLEKHILALHPELLKYDKFYESVSKSEALNKISALPNIGLGLDYISVEERTNINFYDNGKDIIMPVISLSIPIFNNKHRSISRQNKLKQREINASKNNRKNKLETLLSSAINNRSAAGISFEIQLKNLNQAKNVEEILIKNYETVTIDFNDILDIQELQLKFKVNSIEALKNYYTQTTIINYLSN